MKKVILLFAGLFVLCCLRAQLLSWSPEFPADNAAVTITFDASKGNAGLNNFSGDVYIHTGVITNLSTGPGDWKYVPTVWNSNNTVHRMTPLGANKYQYTISNIRTFYGVPANEVIRRLAMVFRSYNAGGNPLEGKATDLSDNQGNIYVPIFALADTAIRINQPFFEARFNLWRESVTATNGGTVPFKGVASKAGNLSLYYNNTLVTSTAAATSLTASPVMNTTGNQVLRMEAVYPDRTLKDSVLFYINPGTNSLPLPPGTKEGINYNPNNTAVTLVLYAPNKNDVMVLGDFNNWTAQSAYQMNRTPDGNYYWVTITGLTPGTEYAYQYLIDGNLRVADPYAQKILDPNSDGQIDVITYPNLKPYPFGKTSQLVGVLQTAEPGYNWQVNNFTRPDKRNLLMYELLVRDFVGGHNWQTLIDTINYLKKLNINAIHVMPFSEFENNDSWGYNPTFYMAPDKYYGTKNKLKEFIDVCHQNGIAVIMDMVLNHEFGQGPHARMYWNAALNRPAVNNPWLNETDKHPFGVGYDFNHESAATKYYTQRTLEHWLSEYKLDGFRFDLSKGFTQKQSNDVGGWSQYDATRIAIWKRYADSVWAKFPNTYLILEHFAETSEDKELANYGFLMWGNENPRYNEATMGYNANSNLSGIVYNSNERQMNQPHSLGFMESHDEERLMNKNIRFGNAAGAYTTKDTLTGLKRIEAAAALFFPIPGPKLMWQFGELGYDYSINTCSDGSLPNDDRCRTARKPAAWPYFAEARRKRLYNVFAGLMNLRRTQTAAFNSNNYVYNLVGAVKWFQLSDPTLNITIMGNFDVVQQSLNITFQNAGTWYDYFTGNTFNATGSVQNIPLRPGEYRIYTSKNLNGVIPNPNPDPLPDPDPNPNPNPNPVDNLTNVKNGLGLKVYPNPLRNTATLKFKVPANGITDISILSAAGQKLSTVFSGNINKGIYVLSMNTKVRPLATGLYALRIVQNGKTNVFKFVKQ